MEIKKDDQILSKILQDVFLWHSVEAKVFQPLVCYKYIIWKRKYDTWYNQKQKDITLKVRVEEQTTDRPTSEITGDSHEQHKNQSE